LRQGIILSRIEIATDKVITIRPRQIPQSLRDVS
jgi:hypothetical protein